MKTCLDRKTLEAFATGTLSATDAPPVERHLTTCTRCARALGKMSIGDDVVEQIRTAQRGRAELGSLLEELSDMEKTLTTRLYGTTQSG